MKELIDIQRELKVHKSQNNDFGKYKYRSCEDILEVVKPLCVERSCLLTLTDEITMLGDRYYIKATATLMEKPSLVVRTVTAFAREAETKKGMDEAQITGSASSYARKYALNGLFLIDDTKDSDATNKHGKEPIAQISPVIAKQQELIKLINDDVTLAQNLKDTCKIQKPVSKMTETELDTMIKEARRV